MLQLENCKFEEIAVAKMNRSGGSKVCTGGSAAPPVHYLKKVVSCPWVGEGSGP